MGLKKKHIEPRYSEGKPATDVQKAIDEQDYEQLETKLRGISKEMFGDKSPRNFDDILKRMSTTHMRQEVQIKEAREAQKSIQEKYDSLQEEYNTLRDDLKKDDAELQRELSNFRRVKAVPPRLLEWFPGRISRA